MLAFIDAQAMEFFTDFEIGQLDFGIVGVGVFGIGVLEQSLFVTGKSRY